MVGPILKYIARNLVNRVNPGYNEKKCQQIINIDAFFFRKHNSAQCVYTIAENYDDEENGCDTNGHETIISPPTYSIALYSCTKLESSLRCKGTSYNIFCIMS